MSRGITGFLWQISVALYLVANGVLGLKDSSGDFSIIFNRMGFENNLLNILIIVASIIAFVAGIAIILDLFSVEVPFLTTLVFAIAVIWAIYIVIEIVSWAMGGFKDVFDELQLLAIHIMVLASLLVASKRFE